MPEARAFDEGFAALTNFYIGDLSFTETLQRVAESSVRAVPVANFAGITMLIDGKERTGVFTDPEAPDLDEIQYRTGEGPCLDAFHHGEIYRIADMSAPDLPWPAFREECRRHGVNSTISLPLLVEEVSYGALNLYSYQQDSFGADEIRIGRRFVSQVAIVVANSYVYTTARALAEQLTEALRHRAEIEQAKGIIMGALRCTPDQAFERLVHQSQHENRKLRDVALGIVAQTCRTSGVVEHV
ncbi:MAG: hypothetical protein JWN99_1781 [Ilumatobacteraceae bacterium]|nr:hypothetical protein [Ilumatobacteraceae bacterium]